MLDEHRARIALRRCVGLEHHAARDDGEEPCKTDGNGCGHIYAMACIR